MNQSPKAKPLGLLTPAEYRAISAAHDACRKANEARIAPIFVRLMRERGLR